MWNRIKENIDKALLGATTLIVFFVIQFLCYIFNPNDLVPMWVVLAVVIVAYICCVIIYAIGKARVSPVQYVLPRISTYRILEGHIILIAEKNDLFSQQSLVTVYHQDSPNDLETAIAIGFVETINPQGNMQIRLIECLNQEMVQNVFKPELIHKPLHSIYVKPTISHEYLERRLSNE